MASTQGQLGGHTVHTHPGHTDPAVAYADRSTSPDEIKRDIDRTRAEMDSTIDELTDRLNPRHLLDDVLDLFRSKDGGDGVNYRETAMKVGKQCARQVKRHPIPSLLFGAGLAYLLFEDDADTAARKRIRRNSREPRMHSGSYVDARTGEPYDDAYGEEWREEMAQPYGDNFPQCETEGRQSRGMGERARGVLSSAGEALSNVGHKISGTASSVAGSVSGAVSGAASSVSGVASSAGSSVSGAVSGAASRTGELASRAGRGTSRMGRRVGSGARQYGTTALEQVQSGYAFSAQRYSDACEEYPMAVGLGYLALGALAGLVLPRTRREDELMGEQADRLKRQARDAGREAVDRGRQVVNATTESLKDDVREQGLTTGSLGEKVMHVAQAALHAAQDAAHEEGIAPSDLAEKAKTVAQHAKETVKHEAKQQTQDVAQMAQSAGQSRQTGTGLATMDDDENLPACGSP